MKKIYFRITFAFVVVTIACIFLVIIAKTFNQLDSVLENSEITKSDTRDLDGLFDIKSHQIEPLAKLGYSNKMTPSFFRVDSESFLMVYKIPINGDFLFEEKLIVRNFNSYKTERNIYLTLPTNMFKKAYKLIDSVSNFDIVILNLDEDNYTKEYMSDSVAIYSTATKKISLQNGNSGPVDLLFDNESIHKASQSEIYFIEFLKRDNEINVIVSAFPNIPEYAHKRKLFFQIYLPLTRRSM